jgi:hypothetical protein
MAHLRTQCALKLADTAPDPDVTDLLDMCRLCLGGWLRLVDPASSAACLQARSRCCHNYLRPEIWVECACFV